MPSTKKGKSDDDKKLDHQGRIADQLREIKRLQQIIQNDKNKADDIVESLPSSDAVADLEGQLAAARQALKQDKLNSKDLQEHLELIAQTNVQLKIAQRKLSSLLLKWTAKYQQRNVLLGTEMHEIILTAKIGKELEDLQQPLPLFDEDEV